MVHHWPSATSASWQASVTAVIPGNQTSKTSVILDKLFIMDLPGRQQDWCICFACPITSLILSQHFRERLIFGAQRGQQGDNRSPTAPGQTKLSTNPPLHDTPYWSVNRGLFYFSCTACKSSNLYSRMTMFFCHCLTKLLQLMGDYRSLTCLKRIMCGTFCFSAHPVMASAAATAKTGLGYFNTHMLYARCGGDENHVWTSLCNTLFLLFYQRRHGYHTM